jgi:hypothetical protein
MGQEGFAGSVLCMTETGAGTGVYAPSEYFVQQIAQTNTANQLAQYLLTASGASAGSQQTWAQSVLNPPLDFTAKPFNSTFMASQYSNAYEFKKLEAAAAARFNYTILTTYDYPKVSMGFLPVSLKYNGDQASAYIAEHCELLNRADFVTTWTPLVSAKALAGMLTIIDKGWGCTSCRAFEYPTGAQVTAGESAAVVNPPFAYLDIIGYESTPSAFAFRQEGIYIARRCGAVNTMAISSGKVAGARLFNQFVTNATDNVPVSCDVKIPNCALCSSNSTATTKTELRWGADG